MNLRHVTAASFVVGFVLNLAGPLAWLACATGGLSASALPARGAEVPFTEHAISTTANGAKFVFATDLDGHIDVLSASIDDDKIAWYENRTPPRLGDLDDDGDGDLEDFALFQQAFSGPK